jgi:hypothetical protein
MSDGQLIADLRTIRAAVAGGATFDDEMRRMAREWTKERGLAVCRAFDEVSNDLTLLDAAISAAGKP